MRVELKEFQATAVTALVAKLQSMRRRYEEEGELTSICLASPTGSGKTVMCAATIESLFFGNDDLGLVPDENAVVLWLSDSPSLNEQTSVRFSNVADKLADSILDRRHLVTVTNGFGASHEMLEPRHVYFLSKDLLSKNGLLTKGGEANSGRVFWDIVDSTIKDPERNLYLFIDEAHRFINTRNPLALNFITTILREARKYFTGLVFASQSIRDYAPESSDTAGMDALKTLFELVQYKFIMQQDSNVLAQLIRTSDVLGFVTDVSEFNHPDENRVRVPIQDADAHATVYVVAMIDAPQAVLDIVEAVRR